MAGVSILINKVRSLYNVGSIFRIADAAGVEKIYLGGYSGITKVGERVELHPKLSKTALSGISVPWEHVPDPIDLIKKLKQEDYQIVSLELTDRSIVYTKANYPKPLCIIVGHERDGVNTKFLKQSDQVVHIPMLGKGKSMNVAIATGILVYEINRQIAD